MKHKRQITRNDSSCSMMWSVLVLVRYTGLHSRGSISQFHSLYLFSSKWVKWCRYFYPTLGWHMKHSYLGGTFALGALQWSRDRVSLISLISLSWIHSESLMALHRGCFHHIGKSQMMTHGFWVMNFQRSSSIQNFKAPFLILEILYLNWSHI